MQGNICDSCRRSVARYRRNGKDYCHYCLERAQINEAMHAIYDSARPAIKALHEEWDKYGSSGVCDSEGRHALQFWLEKKLRGEKAPRITFSFLEGYDCHTPNEKCPYNKREIANAISKAANAMFKAVKKAAREHRVDVYERANDISYNMF